MSSIAQNSWNCKWSKKGFAVIVHLHLSWLKRNQTKARLCLMSSSSVHVTTMRLSSPRTRRLSVPRTFWKNAPKPRPASRHTPEVITLSPNESRLLFWLAACLRKSVLCPCGDCRSDCGVKGRQACVTLNVIEPFCFLLLTACVSVAAL